MPNDIKLIWDASTMQADFGLGYGDLVLDDGFETAVILSLFIDRRADDEDTLPDLNSTDKRGWWGDQVSPDVEGDQIGSRLWLLERSKTTEEVLKKSEFYAEEALQWFLEDEVAIKVNATARRAGNVGNDKLALKVEIIRSDGTRWAKEYQAAWTGQFN